MDVSIIIVSWNVRDQLKKCLQSIQQYTLNVNYEIFVVDNNSQDNAADLIQNEFPNVILIANKDNRGFASACNQAIKKSQGKYVLLLNPDTELKENSILQMINFMEKRNDCGIAGCKIINFDGSVQPSVRKFPDLVSHIFILLKLHNFFLNLSSIKKYYQTKFNYTKEQVVDQVMGAFYMVKHDLLKKIGFFDELYFIWYEEVDLCKVFKNSGFNTYYNPSTEVLHQKGSSFAQVSPLKKQFIFNRSMLHYFFKHSNIFSYLILFVLNPFSLALAGIVQMIGFKKKRKDL